MTDPSPVGSSYRIRVAGHLDDHWSGRLGGHRLVRHADGSTTILTGILDQAQLHGTLAAVRDIAAALLSVQVIHVSADPDAGSYAGPDAGLDAGPDVIVISDSDWDSDSAADSDPDSHSHSDSDQKDRP